MTEFDEAMARLTTAAGHAATAEVESRIPRLLRLLTGAGVRVIVLKGPVTRSRLYDVDEVRPVSDVDLLVDPARFSSATRVLRSVGYRRVDRHGHSDALRRPDDHVDVDLHLTLPYVAVAPKRAFAVLASHAGVLSVAGTPIPVLDTPAHTVHLALHAVVNWWNPTSRTATEWARAFRTLTADERSQAEKIATDLGVRSVWDLAVRSLAGDEALSDLYAAAPLWELTPRASSLRGARRSGVPLIVRRRDLDRMVRLQLGDDTVNAWRADRGEEPLAPGTLAIRLEKGHRLFVVGWAALVRTAQGGVRE